MSNRPSKEAIQAGIANMLAAKLPQTASGGTPPGQSESMKLIPIDKIYAYERNPRRISNDKFIEIKESIRAQGLKTPFFITRRPSDVENGTYCQSRGGATRLAAMQALVEEARAAGEVSPFERVMCIAEQYVDEATLHANHLIENMQRSDMSFWDSAVGMMELKAELERKLGKTLSLRELEVEVAKVGMGLSHNVLGIYQFAYFNFSILDELAEQLSGTSIKDIIRPAYLTCQRLVDKGGLAGQPALTEEEFKTAVIEPTLRAYAVSAKESTTGALDPSALAREIENATASYLGVESKHMPSVMAAFRADSKAALEDLIPKEASIVTEPSLGSPDLDNKAVTTPEDGTLAPTRSDASGTPVFYTQNQVNEMMDTLTQQAAATGAATGAAVAAGVLAGAASGQQGMGGHSLPHVLPSANDQALSIDELRRGIHQLAKRIALAFGIESLILDAPVMPFGYVMELPEQPFASLVGAAEGWSLLTHISGVRLNDPLELNALAHAFPVSADGKEMRLMQYLELLEQMNTDDAQVLVGNYAYPENLSVFLWSALWPSAPLHAELSAMFDHLKAINKLSPTLWRHPMVPMHAPLDEVPEALGFEGVKS